MRWTYASRDTRCSCDITLDDGQLLYAFRVRWAESPSATVEYYRHVAEVFERQCRFEADLLSAGFSLEDFSTAETAAAPALGAPAAVRETIH